MSIGFDTLQTPIGELLIAVSSKGLVRILFPKGDGRPPAERLRDWLRGNDVELTHSPEDCIKVNVQLREYFEGRRKSFSLPLDLRGTPFQVAVWDAVALVPYGITKSYGEIACLIGKPKAVRAVGAANGANPIPIVIPCHRIVGSDGSLTGFGGGLDVKKRLLEFEGLGGQVSLFE